VADAFLDALCGIARDAGKLALGRFKTSFDTWEKSPGNPVSEVDLAVDQFLKERLSALDPEAAWLSEETLDNPDRLAKARVWIVDPIDGTRDFVRGRSGWAISIALADGGQVTHAVLDAPVLGHRWTAVAGQGAFKNGTVMRASQCAVLSGSRVPADSLPKIDSDLTCVDKPNSIAIRIAMVAHDEADLVAALRPSNEWDVAAASLILQEAGGVITDAHGRGFAFNTAAAQMAGLAASGAALHQQVIERLKERANLLL
jgi:myo-inositol-1(or 4)-monophosphatase